MALITSGFAQACVILFSKVKDLEACDWLGWLTYEEEQVFWARIGAANCMNPYLPDRGGDRRCDAAHEAAREG